MLESQGRQAVRAPTALVAVLGRSLSEFALELSTFRGDRWDFLWTQQGEDLDSLLIRGDIVLNDDGVVTRVATA